MFSQCRLTDYWYIQFHTQLIGSCRLFLQPTGGHWAKFGSHAQFKTCAKQIFSRSDITLFKHLSFRSLATNLGTWVPLESRMILLPDVFINELYSQYLAIYNQAVIIIIDDQIWIIVLPSANRNQGPYQGENHHRHSPTEIRTTNCASIVICIPVKFENNILRGCWLTNMARQLRHMKTIIALYIWMMTLKTVIM